MRFTASLSQRTQMLRYTEKVVAPDGTVSIQAHSVDMSAGATIPASEPPWVARLHAKLHPVAQGTQGV